MNVPEAFSSWFGNGEEKPSRETLVLQKEEFEPAVFELCGENKQVNVPEFSTPHLLVKL